MLHTVFRFINDFEKEEIWLNEMASKGYSLESFVMGFYRFKTDSKKTYTYKLEWLKHRFNHPETTAYLGFLRENNIELVTRHINWIYLRKDVKDGPFELFSDLSSRIQHYERIKLLWTAMMIFEFAITLFVLFDFSTKNAGYTANIHSYQITIPLITSSCTGLFLFLRRKMSLKIKGLQLDQILHQ